MAKKQDFWLEGVETKRKEEKKKRLVGCVVKMYSEVK